MVLVKARKILSSHYPVLVVILGLAFYIAFIPHRGYPYPLHVDEWVHLARAEAILQSGSIVSSDPFLGGEMGLGSNLEASFQLFWGVFQAISGISWLTIFRYFPAAIFIITVLSVYVMARREGFGLEAAFFTLLMPTTVGILGPAFLVPVSLGLLFTPLILFLALNFRTVRSYSLIFLFTCFLLAIHAPSAIYPIIVLTPYILLNLKGNFKHSLGLALALILPFLIIFPWIFALLLPTAKSLLTPQPVTEFVQLPRVVQLYGYLPVLLSLLGTFLLGIRGGRKNYGLALGLLALLLMLVTFFSLHYGVPIVYERGLMYMMLMVGIVAGAGLMGIKDLKLPVKFGKWLKAPAITQYAGNFLCLAIAGIILAVAIPQRLATPYYRMIDEQDYQAFIWIKNNVSQDYHKAILDPWKATAFTAITGKHIYTRIHTAPLDEDNRAYDFLKGGSTDTSFLERNGISVVYTRVYEGAQNRNTEFSSSNPDLVQVAKNIYVLKRGQ